MPEVPKIVHERLRSVLPAGTPASVSHPDANLLSAFAEQALSAAEREQVLQHLAVCEDCRTAVVLALPALDGVAVPRTLAESETAARPVPRTRTWFSRPMFAWPNLRWGALAAGLLVAGGLLLHYSGNSNPTVLSRQVASEAKSADIKAPAPETALKSDTSGKKAVVAERYDELAKQKTDTATELDSLVSQNKPVVNRKDSGASLDLFSNKQLTASAPVVANSTAAGMVVGGPVGSSPGRENVQVAPALGAAQTQESKLRNPGTTSSAEELPLTARNEMTPLAGKEAAPAITRAKPATAAEQSAAQTTKAGAQAYELAGNFSRPQTPQFTGIVTDPSGAAVAHAKITVTNQVTGVSISTTTDDSGTYSVNQLPVGTYNLVAQASGFKSAADSNVPLNPGINAHNFTLALGGASETVEVTGAAAALQSGARLRGMAAPSWSLSSGMLRRSQDGGATWLTSLSDARLLCYASRGNEIWAGGKSGLLFYSRDNGSTWMPVHPSIGERSIVDDVTHLEFRSATLVLTTSNGETWSTADAGKNWTVK